MSVQKKKAKKRAKLTAWGIVDAFTAFIYSLFVNGRVGALFSAKGISYKGSRCENFLEKKTKNRMASSKLIPVIENSRVLCTIVGLRDFLASLALNVYAVFFMTYGLTSVLIYYITIATNGKNDHGVSTLVSAIAIVICSIPAMTSTKSAIEVMAESRVMKWVCSSLLGIPEEKMRSRKDVSGAEFMFMAAIIAMLFGIFSYFLHSLYVPVIFGIVVALCLIFASPEAGVVMTVAITPFLQFSGGTELILVLMILTTSIAYGLKVLKWRRTLSWSGEAIFVFIFCGFTLLSSVFTDIGAPVLKDGLTSVVVILGGFYLTYNLIRGEKRLRTCVRILAVSFVALSVAGLWNAFYSGIADGIMYSVREDVSSIFNNSAIYIADNKDVFGVLAVMIAPLVFSCAPKCKSAKGVAAVMITTVLTFISTYVYGSFEAFVALGIEFILFWLIYSHKSLTVIIFAAIPIGIFAIVSPYFSSGFGVGGFDGLLEKVLPMYSFDASFHVEAVKSTVNMLLDGNLMGIGAGEYAFNAAYPAYATVVSEGVSSPTSFWLQLVCWSGIGGAITFVLLGLALFKNSVNTLMVSENKDMRTDTVALFCGIFVSLIYGSVSCLWNDIRMLYLFWAMAGLLSAYVREQNEQDERKFTEYENVSHATDLEVRFYK